MIQELVRYVLLASASATVAGAVFEGLRRRAGGMRLATRPRSMAIDASRIRFVDSSGLGALLSARHAVRTEAGLAFRVIDPSPALLRVVEIAGFMELLSGE